MIVSMHNQHINTTFSLDDANVHRPQTPHINARLP